MAVDIKVDISGAVSALSILFNRVQARVIDALDEGAALVLNSAREGHPKVHDSIQGFAALPFRQFTPAGAGMWAGQYRFLTRTGNLRNSIKIEGAKQTPDGFSSAVFSAIEYADRIEETFPFVRPALETNRREITRRVGAAVRGGVG